MLALLPMFLSPFGDVLEVPKRLPTSGIELMLMARRGDVPCLKRDKGAGGGREWVRRRVSVLLLRLLLRLVLRLLVEEMEV